MCMSFKCPICDSDAHENLYSKQVLHPLIGLMDDCFTTELNYEQCQQCGYIGLYPLFDEKVYAEYYSKVGSPSNAAFEQRSFIYEQRKNFVENTLGGGYLGKIIEVGASKGDLLKLFSTKNKLIGIELSEDCIEAAKNLPIKYYPHSLEDTPNKSPELLNSANVVIACHVLEHTHHPKVFFKHLVTLLADKGYLYIEVPSVEAIAACKKSIANTLHIGHISFFSISTLNLLAFEEGLYPVSIEVSTDHNFPTLRVIYKKHTAVGEITQLFNQHATDFDKESLSAYQLLKKELDVNAPDAQYLIWGVGQDCLDVLKYFGDDVLDDYRDRILLTDISKRKQGDALPAFKVYSPEEIIFKDIACIVISTRSQLIQSDISKHLQSIAPSMKIINLYSK